LKESAGKKNSRGSNITGNRKEQREIKKPLTLRNSRRRKEPDETTGI